MTSASDAYRWPAPVEPIAQVELVFEEHDPEEPAHHNLSAAAISGTTLFVAGDETATIEALSFGDGRRFVGHSCYRLGDWFDLPEGADAEMDIEGLAVDSDRLWIVGSHSLTRKKPKKDRPVDAAAIEALASIRAKPNRLFLGFVPLSPASSSGHDVCFASPGLRPPAMLPLRKHHNELSKVLSKDELLAPFMALPAKENGFDIEGIAVDGERVAVGLRGPVINGWACLVELRVVAKRDGTLRLKRVDGKRRYAKRWLALDGLGIRDLKRDGDDLLILAGPTMDLDGPLAVYRWHGWATGQGPDNPNGDRGNGHEGATDDKAWNSTEESPLLITPELIAYLPYGRGCDHAEAIVPVTTADKRALLVLHDSPAPTRFNAGGEAVTADLYDLV